MIAALLAAFTCAWGQESIPMKDRPWAPSSTVLRAADGTSIIEIDYGGRCFLLGRHVMKSVGHPPETTGPSGSMARHYLSYTRPNEDPPRRRARDEFSRATAVTQWRAPSTGLEFSFNGRGFADEVEFELNGLPYVRDAAYLYEYVFPYCVESSLRLEGDWESMVAASTEARATLAAILFEWLHWSGWRAMEGATKNPFGRAAEHAERCGEEPLECLELMRIIRDIREVPVLPMPAVLPSDPDPDPGPSPMP